MITCPAFRLPLLAMFMLTAFGAPRGPAYALTNALPGQGDAQTLATKAKIQAQIDAAVVGGDGTEWIRLNQQLLPHLTGDENEPKRADVLRKLGHLLYREGRELEGDPYLREALPLLERHH